MLSFIGIIFALLGHFLLGNNPEINAGIMTFSSGGIIYLIFQDIAPMCKMEKTWMPTLGASLGFLVGLLLHQSMINNESCKIAFMSHREESNDEAI